MLLEIITAGIGILGLIFGLYQYHVANKVRRSETLSQLIFRLWSDEEIRTTVYMFEYEDSWYKDGFKDSETEIKVDKTLQYLSYICYLYKQGIIKENEFNIFEYEISRLFQNESAIRYLRFLPSFSKIAVGKADGEAPCPFQDLLDYGLEHGYYKQ